MSITISSWSEMSHDPIKEIATEMRKKMEKILSPPPAICIVNGQTVEIQYIDKLLENYRNYILEYIKDNFTLIEDGQYALPMPNVLLGFFKISPKLMFVLFRESGKIGNLLLYRGLLENYGSIIEELYKDLEEIKEIEQNANLILKLREKGVAKAPAVPVEETKAAVQPSPAVEVAKPADVGVKGPMEGYPLLLERYRNKKFNFMEGVILQHCRGELTINEIASKSKYSKEEVVEIINTYKKKGWLVLLKKKGVEVVSPQLKEETATNREITTKFVEKVGEIVESARIETEKLLKMYPELIDKYRNKKVSFKEGIILQLCNGQRSVEQILAESNIPEDEVLEIIDTYQKKGWLIIHV